MERARSGRRLTDLRPHRPDRPAGQRRRTAAPWPQPTRRGGLLGSQTQPALNIDDAQTIAWLLLDIAGHPLVPDQLSQRARAWATALERLGATS